jgi:hypothetical protein
LGVDIDEHKIFRIMLVQQQCRIASSPLPLRNGWRLRIASGQPSVGAQDRACSELVRAAVFTPFLHYFVRLTHREWLLGSIGHNKN